MWTVLLTLLLILQIGLAILVGYLLILTFAAHKAISHTSLPQGNPRFRFIILVPAHNEERLLPSLLSSIQQLDYPHSKISLHVVADNCSDTTAQVAQQGGATVHQRFNQEQVGKGHALNWLFNRLQQQGVIGDAVVVLDADTIISSNFLKVMDAHLQQGARVIQAYYSVRDPQNSWSNNLRFAALAVLHYLRPQGRMVLGASAGLKGNGMVFLKEILEQYSWSQAITEDIEFHMALLFAGERVIFAPDAVVWAEMPDRLSNAQTQHDRWEQGRLEMARKYIPQLLQTAWREIRQKKYKQGYLLFDAAMEHIIPPFSILAGLTILFFTISAFTVILAQLTHGTMGSLSGTAAALASWNLVFAIFLITGQVFYILSGLSMVQAPKTIYTTLVFTPFLILWKTARYLKVLLRRDRPDWIRTSRNQA